MKNKNVRAFSLAFLFTILLMTSACGVSFKPSHQGKIDLAISWEVSQLPGASLNVYGNCDGFKKDMTDLADYQNSSVSLSVENVTCDPKEKEEGHGQILAASAKITKTFTNTNIGILFGEGPVLNGSIIYVLAIQDEHLSFKASATNLLSDQRELDFQDLAVEYLDTSNRTCAGSVRVDNSSDCSVSSSCEECL